MPACNSPTALPWRIMCGVTWRPWRLDRVSEARRTYLPSKKATPSRVRGAPRAFRNRGLSVALVFTSRRRAAAVSGHSGQRRSLPPLPKSRTCRGRSSRSCRGWTLRASLTRAPVLYRKRSKARSRAARGVRSSTAAMMARASSGSR